MEGIIKATAYSNPQYNEGLTHCGGDFKNKPNFVCIVHVVRHISLL
jgi:hypothetical protein